MPYQAPLVPYVLFEADPPDLPVRQRGDGAGPEYVARAAVAAEETDGLTLAGTTCNGQGMTVRLRVVAPGIVRVTLTGEDAAPHRVTLARGPALSGAAGPVEVAVEQSEGRVVLRSDAISVQVSLDPFHIAFYGPDGRPILSQTASDTDVTDRLVCLPFGYSEVAGRRVAFHDAFVVEPDEHFYGFGEKFTDFDKRGQRLKMWHYDAYGAHSERAYKNVPFFLSTRGYGLFVDSIWPVEFDMAANSHASLSVIVPGDTALDYYVIAGPDPKTIITRYASLVSLPILPPKWAFGLWMSSGFKADSAEAVVERAHSLRERGIPCDVLHLDCFWQKRGRWSDMQWDTEVFPDPEELLRRVKDAGFRVCLWINPYIGIESPLHKEADEKGYFLKTVDGQSWVGDLWGGDGHVHPPVSIVDMTNPEAARWYGDLLRPSLRMGADVYKTDFGEGVPADVVAHNGMTGVQLHNYYPLLYNDLVARVTVEETGGPGMVWGRSTYAGGQRHAAQWSGDPNCTYQGMASTLRGGLSMGVCGHAFWSHDIGGFHHTPTPDVFIRWAQFGLLSPLSRAHGMSSRLPWDYGEEAERIFRDYTRLRYRLLPYLYSCAVVAHQTSLPILRAMVVEYPDDPVTYGLDLQYMLGEALLVAPVYNAQGRRPVYLPAGKWVDFWTRQVFQGPQMLMVEVPLETLPLYVRADALLPTIDPPASLSEEPFDRVSFDAYLLESGRFTLHDTDGDTTVAAAFDGGRLVITVDGAKARLTVNVLPLAGQPAVDAVLVNGQVWERVDGLAVGEGSVGGWARREDGTISVSIPQWGESS